LEHRWRARCSGQPRNWQTNHVRFSGKPRRDRRREFCPPKFPGEKIGVIGVPMGAAALLAEPPLPVSAMVLESCYPMIYQATDDRMKMRFEF
jgi:hypothetical protein